MKKVKKVSELNLEKLKILSVKIPEEVYEEMILRIPEGGRSDFIRNAIKEKLEKTPKPDKILFLEDKINSIELEVSKIKKCLADLELITYEGGKMNPHIFCTDEVDHKIMDYLMHYKGATTPEIAEYLKTNRWLVLNRLKKIQRSSKKQIGKAIIDYNSREKAGKKRSWWINEEIIEN